MKNIQIVKALLIACAMIMTATVSFAQSSAPDSKNSNQIGDNSDRNMDLAPAVDEKPHVIGDDGKKIYFLAKPSSFTSENPVERREPPVAPSPLNSPKPE